MCGICGMAGANPLTPRDVARVQAMNRAMVHRGPDGEGSFFAGPVAMAMRRLSIIDLAGGWQPLYNEDETLVLVANGEIYNYVELREDLIRRGHQFRTGSDCETVLHLFEEKGVACVDDLRGMFALALWDTRSRRLWLARDRMGEKPLYLCEQNGTLLFASELGALLRAGTVAFELDPSAVDLFFHYLYVPEPMTPLVGVRKLGAGCSLTVETDPWRLSETPYWRMEDAPRIEGDPVQIIRDELERVSEVVIRSDVPVGIALSGGLDSSAVAALVEKKYPGIMHAFGAGYPGRPRNDERADARRLADHLGMPFHEVEIDTRDMVAQFPNIVRQRDDPIADIAGHGYFAVMRAAREHDVPVMLQGQGGDELFWGYPWLCRALGESRQKQRLRPFGWAGLPFYLRPRGPEGWNHWQLRHWARRLFGLADGWDRFKRHQSTPGQMVFYDVFPDYLATAAALPTLYADAFRERVARGAPWQGAAYRQGCDLDISITRLICETYLRENGIAQADRLSMVSSIELRLPLMDHRFVETVIGLRKGRKDHTLGPKHWFREALKGILPDWVLDRPKLGFNPPVREWHAALFAAYGDQLRGGYLVEAGVLAPTAAEYLAAGPYPEGERVALSFKALVLEIWCRQMQSAMAA